MNTLLDARPGGIYSWLPRSIENESPSNRGRTTMTKARPETTDEGNLTALFEVAGFPLP